MGQPLRGTSKILAYPSWLAERLGPLRPRGVNLPNKQADGFDNSDLLGYPSNHIYRIDDGRLLPSFDLYWRSRILEELYARPLGSLLDVGSCKGWFVLNAARRADCEQAVGIDIYQPWIDLSRQAAKSLHLGNAAFHMAFLQAVFDDPTAFGAPFRNILVINAYHYLFWGSGMFPDHFPGHDAILQGLHRICSDRIIFANPLELTDAPKETRGFAAGEPERAAEYTTSRFLSAAKPLFDIESRGKIGKRDLMVLHRK